MTQEEIGKALLRHALQLLDTYPMSDSEAERLDSSDGLIEHVRVHEQDGDTHYLLTNGRSHRYVATDFLVTVPGDGAVSWRAQGDEIAGSLQLKQHEAIAEYERYRTVWIMPDSGP